MSHAKLKSHPRAALPAALALGGSVLAGSILAAVLCAAPLAAHADTGGAARPAPVHTGTVYTGNYIVRWRDVGQATVADPTPASAAGTAASRMAGSAATSSADSERMKRVASNTGLALSLRRPMSNALQLLSVVDSRGDDPETVARRLRQDPRVADAVPDRWLRPMDTTPNDPLFATNQPYLGSPTTVIGGVNLPRAWDRSRGSSNIVVAVVDTGYLDHPDLSGRLVAGYDFISSTTVSVDGDGRDGDAHDPGDYTPSGTTCQDGTTDPTSSWHGTRVAGVLGAATNNVQGMAGVDWSARIQPVRVSGRCGALLSDTVDGMRWAGGLSVTGVPANPTPARVVNVSLGGGKCSSIEQQTVNDLNAAGVIVVAAAGNSASAVEAPADCTGVIAVTAHTNDGDHASYANSGTQVAISAPGGGCGATRIVNGTCATPSLIVTTSNDGAAGPGNFVYDLRSAGTSFATPIVSGVVALMLAVNPQLTPAQVTAVLKNTARAHPAGTYCTTGSNVGTCGAGLLDADAALATAPNPGSAGASTGSTTASTDSGGGGGAFAPWSALVLLGIGLAGFATRRRVKR